jgi:hypothetical protein
LFISCSTSLNFLSFKISFFLQLSGCDSFFNIRDLGIFRIPVRSLVQIGPVAHYDCSSRCNHHDGVV